MTKPQSLRQELQDLKQRARASVRAAVRAAAKTPNGARVRTSGATNTVVSTTQGGGTSGAYAIQDGSTVRQGVLTDDGWVTREYSTDPRD